MINGKQKLISNTYKINNSASCFFILTGDELKLIIDSAFFTAN